MLVPLHAPPHITRRFWPVVMRNLLVWKKLAVPSILGNIAEPLITLVAFGYGVGSLIGQIDGMPYIQYLASGSVAVSAALAATFEALYSAYSRMAVQKTWDSILNAPIALDDIVFAEMLWAAMKALFSCAAILVVIFVLGIRRAPTMLLALPVLGLVGVTFASIALVFNAVAKGYDFFTYYFTLVVTPMTFLSGVYFPIAQMPHWLQGVASVLPLKAAVDLVRPLVLGNLPAEPLGPLLILLGYAGSGYYLAGPHAAPLLQVAPRRISRPRRRPTLMQARLLAWLRTAGIVLIAAMSGHALGADDFLEPHKAFKFSARPLDDRSVEVSFIIAPGYYLYRDQFRFEAVGATLTAPALPAGKVKFDETFQKNVETYRDRIAIVVSVAQAAGGFMLTTTSQGCADAGLCYPPMQSGASVSLAAFGGSGSVQVAAAGDSSAARSGLSAALARSAAPAGASATTAGGAGAIEAVLQSGSFWAVVGAFFVAGLLLSLTPCVLPMLPIVSSIIVGQGNAGPGAGSVIGSEGPMPVEATGVSRRRGLALAASYSLGMAVVYTGLGIAAGLAGEGLAATLQNPWVLGAFAVALVALSFSMFGLYELQLPAAVRCRFADAAQQMPGGRVAGVCAMGGVSALIVSPCVAAPLAGALLYLSQTGDVVLGGTALFSLAAGMSVPLLLVGASAGALLPRAGAWMVEVKAAFGVLLLGVALWTIQPVLAASLAVALWGVLALGTAAFLLAKGRSAPGRRAGRRALAGLLAIVGLVQIVGAAAGGTDPLQPLARLASRGGVDPALGLPSFTGVKSGAELDAALRNAGRPVMLDFYADWCVSCKEMERFTLTDPAVRRRLAGALLLKADVTANDTDDRELLRRFRLFGPPGTIFFDARGQELPAARLVGFQSSRAFLETLRRAGI